MVTKGDTKGNLEYLFLSSQASPLEPGVKGYCTCDLKKGAKKELYHKPVYRLGYLGQFLLGPLSTSDPVVVNSVTNYGSHQNKMQFLQSKSLSICVYLRKS